MKRYRPEKPKRRKRDPPQMPVLFAPPEDNFYRLPELEIRNGVVQTDGCRRVLEFSPEQICLDMGAVVITLYGANMQIESFSGRRLAVTGRISRLDFTSRWRGRNGKG